MPQEPAAWGWAAAVTLVAWLAFHAIGWLLAGSRIGLVFFVVIGIFRIQGDLAPLYAGIDPIAEGDAVAHGRIERPAEFRDGETVLHLENVGLRRNGVTVHLELPLQIIVPGAAEGYGVGDLVTVRGRMRVIRGDHNLGWFPGPIATRGNRYAARLIAASAACAGVRPRMPSGKPIPGRPDRFSTR